MFSGNTYTFISLQKRYIPNYNQLVVQQIKKNFNVYTRQHIQKYRHKYSTC